MIYQLDYYGLPTNICLSCREQKYLSVLKLPLFLYQLSFTSRAFSVAVPKLWNNTVRHEKLETPKQWQYLENYYKPTCTNRPMNTGCHTFFCAQYSMIIFSCFYRHALYGFGVSRIEPLCSPACHKR